MKKLLAVAGVAVLLSAPLGAADTKTGLTAAAAFERLKSLAGAWQGAVGEASGPPVEVTYRLTGGGSAVAETLFSGTPHEMLSVYHLDGEDLVMTHYCAAGNQPKMRLDRTASTPDRLRFVFAGGTNIKEAEPHIHEGWIAPQGSDALDAEWTPFLNGKPMPAHKMVAMKRRK